MLRFAALALLAAATPLQAESRVTVQSVVFVEHIDHKGFRIESARRFARGDTVVTVMAWQGPTRSSSTIVSPVPPALELESVSRDGLEFSLDGGRSWRLLADARELPHGVTHLRWSAGGNGRLSYRAVVR